MKKWNFFARALCVMSLCVFASCSSPSGGSSGNGGGSAQPALSVTETRAGTRPANVTGSQTLPTFEVNITDHLYLAESAANATGYIRGSVSNASTYQWYTGTTGNWQAVSGATSKNLKITATTGTTYYMLEAKSSDGQSIAYSNVCTVVCGGDKTTNIGKIAYSDGTCSNEYEAAKTPIGIVFDVNAEGTPKKIVNLSQASSKMWCSSSAAGYNKNFVTGVDTPLSYTDGSGNWQIICDNVTDANTEGYYPAFEYCKELTDGGKSWYLPARDELMTLYFNRTAVKSAIEKLPSGTATKVSISGWFWSSSQYASGNNYAWNNYFDFGDQGYVSKCNNGNVRGVAGF